MGKKTSKRKERKKARLRRTCFVVSPIGQPGSNTRQRADAVLKQVIQPALILSNVEYKATRIDNKGGAGNIGETIIDLLLSADLVVADLTDLNPNVMYEIGIRQAWGLPVLPIIQASQIGKLPFDLKDMRIVTYGLTSKKARIDAIVGIRKQLRDILADERKDTIFRKAILRVGKEYSMDTVYKALQEALSDMHSSLGNCRHELLHVSELGDPMLMNKLSEVLQRIFRVLSDKLFVFRQMFIGHPYKERADYRGLTLIENCYALLRRASRIDAALTSKRMTKAKGNVALNNLDEIMDEIRQVALSIETGRRSPSRW